MPARAVLRLLLLVAVCALRTASAATTQDVTLATPTGTLAGSLMRPDGDAKVPVVLLIAGSGPTDRDGNSVGLQGHPDTLRLLAAALADAGFASLRYDKRGVAASAAALKHEQDIRFDDSVDDAAAWVAQLAGDGRFGAVAIVGHSEGALIGLLAAERGHVAALVTAGGLARSAADVLRVQLEGRLRPEVAGRAEEILTSLQRGQRVDDVPAGLNMLYRPSVQPYLISYFRHVPATDLAGLTIPCLIAQGEADTQTAPSEATALHAALPRSELLMVPGMTHMLKLVPPGPDGQSATYLDPTLPLAPDFVHGLTAFLTRSLKPPTP